jgi:hypothetical protein
MSLDKSPNQFKDLVANQVRHARIQGRAGPIGGSTSMAAGQREC